MAAHLGMKGLTETATGPYRKPIEPSSYSYIQIPEVPLPILMYPKILGTPNDLSIVTFVSSTFIHKSNSWW
jgi:hypothetical protein